MELRHVILFNRHGDRTPIYTDLNSLLKISDEELIFWKTTLISPEKIEKLHRIAKVVGEDATIPPYCDPRHGGHYPGGHLTEKGMVQLKEKGEKLWERYHHLFGKETIRPEAIYASSTNYYRTIQSAQALLMGMFKHHDGGSPKFHVRTKNVETVVPEHSPELYFQMQELYLQELDPLIQAKIKKTEVCVRQLFQIPSADPVNWTAVRDVLTCKKAHNLEWPEGVTEEIYADVVDADAALWYQCFSHKGLGTTFFSNGIQELTSHLKKILGDDVLSAEKRAHDIGGPKISVYSCHDCTLVSLVNALNLDTNKMLPPYATIVTFEIYQSSSDSKYYIKVLWNDEVLKFKNFESETFLPFETFKKIAARNF
uniref:Histidine acid phosphatase putative n=1 Tax=Albugo laibachii Nc14 TaxID=890382 RepID=F0WB10_9STRA|nr:histidine acid phosphatase putative [Albugo laibachii Nc14]CCA18395.1 histidine acid phosphatase putative [Albugo laibachii Nc14]|eukprot:CCA18395.1 histidine acid phosphatase putative [Albugo laibachii Nc14]